jgi:hypothetical protein
MSVTVDPYQGPVVLPDDPSLGPEVQVDYPGYRSTQWRVPKRPLATLPEELHRLDGPVFGEGAIEEHDNDLTRQHAGEPLGERIIVTGRVLDEDGRPFRGALVEIWQANAGTGTRSTSTRRRSTRTSPAPAAASPTTTAATASRRSSRARTPGATTRTRGAPTTSTSRSSGGRSSSGS